MRTTLLLLAICILGLGVTHAAEPTRFDPAPSINVSLSWSAGGVTVTFPSSETPVSVAVDGNLATFSGGAWTATTDSGESHAIRSSHGPGVTYSNSTTSGTGSVTLYRE